MTIDAATFTFHDVSLWPIVRHSAAAIQPGYSKQWEHEMDALLAISMPFVIIMEGDEHAEEHKDRKARGIWLKKNKAALATVCKAVIGIEASAIKRGAMQLQMSLATKAFGIKIEIVASREEALHLAERILKGKDAASSLAC